MPAWLFILFCWVFILSLLSKLIIINNSSTVYFLGHRYEWVAPSLELFDPPLVARAKMTLSPGGPKLRFCPRTFYSLISFFVNKAKISEVSNLYTKNNKKLWYHRYLHTRFLSSCRLPCKLPARIMRSPAIIVTRQHLVDKRFGRIKILSLYKHLRIKISANVTL